jgi:hypothetical protein
MARSHLRETLNYKGKPVQNAAVYVYQPGTTTDVAGMWSQKTGGVAVANPILTNNQGEVEAWLEAAQSVDLKFTDNSDLARDQEGGVVTFADFTEQVEVRAAPEDTARLDIANTFAAGLLVSAPTGTDPAFEAQVAGDTGRRLHIRRDGQIWFGSGAGAVDTVLRRMAATLLGTEHSFQASGVIADGSWTTAFQDNDQHFWQKFNGHWRFKIGWGGGQSFFFESGGTQRFKIHGEADKISFGAAEDTNLYRVAANRLQTDDGFVVAAPGGLIPFRVTTPSGQTGDNAYQINLKNLGNPNHDWMIGQLPAGNLVFATEGGAGPAQRVAVSGSFDGLVFGAAEDTNLYRSEANRLRTDDSFEVAGQSIYLSLPSGTSVIEQTVAAGALVIRTAADAYIRFDPGGPAEKFRMGSDGRLYFGAGLDTNIYRAGADLLKTDDALQVAGLLAVLSGSDLSIDNGKLRYNAVQTAGAAAAGASGAPPAQVAGYLLILVDGVTRKVPFYAN